MGRRSRARRAEQFQPQQKSSRGWWYILYFPAILMVLVIIGTTFLPSKPKGVEAPQQTQINFQFTQQEAEELVNSLISAVNPGSEENAYLPEFAKDKITWLYAEIDGKRLDFAYEFSPTWPAIGKSLMASTYRDGRPTLVIYADRLMVHIRVDGKTASGFNRMQKNNFAAALVHEAVHLELKREWFEGNINDTEVIDAEEFRAWSIVDQLMITPMMKLGEPIDPDHLAMHHILVGCNHQMPCQAFLDRQASTK